MQPVFFVSSCSWRTQRVHSNSRSDRILLAYHFFSVAPAAVRTLSNNFPAGSSVGSWGTSWPRNALARREGVSFSTCPRALANCNSSWSASANNLSTRHTISCNSKMIPTASLRNSDGNCHLSAELIYGLLYFLRASVFLLFIWS
jgi:hypothetical protein